jgi:large subunit ribosomal protein L19
MNTLMRFVERLEPNPNIPELRPGDTVRVHNRIVEGNRERIQVFQGVVMRIRRGGANASFTVRRIASHGVGVERTFFFHSPRVEKVEVLRHGKVRRAKLYFLRGRTGKKARLQETRRIVLEEPTEPIEPTE